VVVQAFLGLLGEDDRGALLAEGRRSVHRPGEVILHEGSKPTTVAVVLEGTVKLVKLALGGREVVLELRGTGEVIGELGAIDDEPRSASVVALDDVVLFVLDADRFRHLLRERAGIGHAVIVTVTRRLREAAARQLEFGSSDGLRRVCRRVAELAASHGVETEDGVLIDHAMSQQELADWAGVSRDGVVRALTELRRMGWIETGRQRLVVRRLDDVRQRGEV
jgi:CRP-like cAMP-binding protein